MRIFLCALSLPTNTTAAELFKSLDVVHQGTRNGPIEIAYAQRELLP